MLSERREAPEEELPPPPEPAASREEVDAVAWGNYQPDAGTSALTEHKQERSSDEPPEVRPEYEPLPNVGDGATKLPANSADIWHREDGRVEGDIDLHADDKRSLTRDQVDEAAWANARAKLGEPNLEEEDTHQSLKDQAVGKEAREPGDPAHIVDSHLLVAAEEDTLDPKAYSEPYSAGRSGIGSLNHEVDSAETGMSAEASDPRVTLALEPIIDATPVDDGNCNSVYRAELADGRVGYLKPEGGEDPDLRPGDVPPHQEWHREIFACEFDRSLGFNVVPDTVPRYEVGGDIGGNASLQEEAPFKGRPLDEYEPLDRQRMAVLDYVLGNLDRHDNNYRTQRDGRPAAIDNGLTLPETSTGAIVSPWVVEQLGEPLDGDITAAVQRVDEARLRDELKFHRIRKDNRRRVARVDLLTFCDRAHI
jgi:hypothetical protein